jgi:hypothetical protein
MILALASASFLQILGPADEEGTLLTADSLFDSLTKTAIASRNSRQQTKIPLSACIPQASRICVYMSSVFTGQQQARNFTVHQSLIRFFFKIKIMKKRQIYEKKTGGNKCGLAASRDLS